MQIPMQSRTHTYPCRLKFCDLSFRSAWQTMASSGRAASGRCNIYENNAAAFIASRLWNAAAPGGKRISQESWQVL
ncbi:hypothetical protein N9L68_05605 [bacterium]|nr:hypothetical protein [bacterium]